jgi:hypothetical protein
MLSWAMADVHQFITLYGIEEARRQAVTKRERQSVETAYQVLTDDAARLGFTYSGFALTALPHRTTDALVWRREGHNLTLIVESGLDQRAKPIGLPYGSYARYILLFLQTEAIKTNSREIELGSSMRCWLNSMGVSIGGVTYKAVAEQAKRISTCRLTFFGSGVSRDIRRNGSFVKDAITMSGLIDDDQPTLWQDRVVLEEEFYRALREHPVPVSEAALRAIGPRSMVLDLYVFLAYRLHSLQDNAHVGWPSIYAQFGFGFASSRRFKQSFLECIQLALAAYPDARVTITDTGLTLHPSRPPIAKLG